MHEPDLAKAQPQQLLERTLLPIARRLRRHPGGLVDRNPVLALANDRQLRRVFHDRDPIVRTRPRATQSTPPAHSRAPAAPQSTRAPCAARCRDSSPQWPDRAAFAILARITQEDRDETNGRDRLHHLARRHDRAAPRRPVRLRPRSRSSAAAHHAAGDGVRGPSLVLRRFPTTEQRALAAIALVAPGMLLDTISAIWFPLIFPNIRAGCSGLFGGWLLFCNVVVLLTAVLYRPAAA